MTTEQTIDRCFNGTLHSNERNYLDSLWKQLGVEPTNVIAGIIEARLIRAALKQQITIQEELERKFAQKVG